MRRSIILVAAIALFALAALTGNYFLVHRDMREAIASDPRNVGLVFFGYHDKLVWPGTIKIDIRDVSATNSPADVFRLLLQFAAKQKDKNYDKVILAFRGDPRFVLKGEYFKVLGAEYGTQNPTYTMRTFPENLYNVDGTPAFGTWTGGLLGVLGKQIEDFTEFHKRWYINSLGVAGA